MLAVSLAQFLNGRGIHYGWVMVALTFTTMVCSSAAFGMPGVLILPISQEFGWTRGDVSGAIALMLLLFGGLAPFAGALMLRYGLRTIVVSAAIMSVAALLITTQMTSKWQMWLSLGLLLGTSAGITALVLAATVANRWFMERRGLAVGILTAAFAAGQLIFLPTAAWLATHYGWRSAVIPGIAGCSICAGLYILFGRDWPADVGLPPYGGKTVLADPPPSASNAVAMSLAVLREASSYPAFWVVAGTFFICGVSTSGTVQQHFIPFCADNGINAVTAASTLAVIGIFNFVGTIGSGWLTDRYDPRWLLAWYYGFRGLSLMWLPFSGFDIVSLSLFAVFFGLDFVATVPPTVKLTGQFFEPTKAPIIFGWAFASHQVGGATAAFATGVSRDMLATYVPAFFAAGVICLIAATAVMVLRRPQHSGGARSVVGLRT